MRSLKVIILFCFTSIVFLPVQAQETEIVFVGFPEKKINEAGIDRVVEEISKDDAKNWMSY